MHPFRGGVLRDVYQFEFSLRCCHRRDYEDFVWLGRTESQMICRHSPRFAWSLNRRPMVDWSLDLRLLLVSTGELLEFRMEGHRWSRYDRRERQARASWWRTETNDGIARRGFRNCPQIVPGIDEIPGNRVARGRKDDDLHLMERRFTSSLLWESQFESRSRMATTSFTFFGASNQRVSVVREGGSLLTYMKCILVDGQIRRVRACSNRIDSWDDRRPRLSHSSVADQKWNISTRSLNKLQRDWLRRNRQNLQDVFTTRQTGDLKTTQSNGNRWLNFSLDIELITIAK